MQCSHVTTLLVCESVRCLLDHPHSVCAVLSTRLVYRLTGTTAGDLSLTILTLSLGNPLGRNSAAAPLMLHRKRMPGDLSLLPVPTGGSLSFSKAAESDRARKAVARSTTCRGLRRQKSEGSVNQGDHGNYSCVDCNWDSGAALCCNASAGASDGTPEGELLACWAPPDPTCFSVRLAKVPNATYTTWSPAACREHASTHPRNQGLPWSGMQSCT
jgi:hypothetical protein